MISGIGIDLVAVPRLERALERRGDEFARHILAEAEWNEYTEVKDKARFLAKRFACKEAFSKACGTGIRPPVALGSIWISHDALGRPLLQLAPDVRHWLDERLGTWSVHVSLADEKELVVAQVLLEYFPEPA